MKTLLKKSAIALIILLLVNVNLKANTIFTQIDDSTSNQKTDTTRIKLGNRNIIIVNNENDEQKVETNVEIEENEEDSESSNINLNNDSTENKDGNKKTKKRKYDGKWAGVEFGVNNFVNSNNELAVPINGKFMDLNTSKSRMFAINFYNLNIPLIGSYVGLTSGVGLTFNHYSFSQNMTLKRDVDSIYGVIDTVNTFKKNRLNVTSLSVPVLLGFNIPVSHHRKDYLHLTCGVIGYLKTGSNLKQETSETDKKIKDDFHLQLLRADATIRLGFRDVNLFVNYSLTEMFNKGKGPELYPVSMGIGFRF